MNQTIDKVNQLKKEKNAIILAHYYVPEDVQKVADYIGDSFYLSKIAKQAKADILVFCGVSFMGESAKILNPDKLVLMPDPSADCPMAHMATNEKIKLVREKYDDVAVVCYINSVAQLKELSDVCVTSANAIKIVKNLPNKHIYFIPDEHLGRYVASLVPEKEFIFNDGFCPVHGKVSKDNLTNTKDKYPNAKFLAHPECPMELLKEADYVGSTSGIIDYATKSDDNEFIIGTEVGVMAELRKKNPDKIFHALEIPQVCEDMKKVTLDKVLKCLKDETGVVTVDSNLSIHALEPLNKMLELAAR